MSKVDAQRAMREARFAAYREKLAAEARAAAATPVRPAAAPKPAAAPAADAAAPEAPVAPDEPETLDTSGEGADPEAGLCGHRNMSNKTCRRVAGHSEKNHRYT